MALTKTITSGNLADGYFSVSLNFEFTATEHLASETLFSLANDLTNCTTANTAIRIEGFWVSFDPHASWAVEITDSEDNTIVVLNRDSQDINSGHAQKFLPHSKKLSDDATGDLKIKTIGSNTPNNGDVCQIVLAVTTEWIDTESDSGGR